MSVMKFEQEVRYVFEYEAVRFNGDNAQEILDFVTERGGNCDRMETPTYRPKYFDIDWHESDCLKFWEKLDLNPSLKDPNDKLRYHNLNNFESWSCGEKFYITISEGNGYCSRHYFKDGMWIVYNIENGKFKELYDSDINELKKV